MAEIQLEGDLMKKLVCCAVLMALFSLGAEEPKDVAVVQSPPETSPPLKPLIEPDEEEDPDVIMMEEDEGDDSEKSTDAQNK